MKHTHNQKKLLGRALFIGAASMTLAVSAQNVDSLNNGISTPAETPQPIPTEDNSQPTRLPITVSAGDTQQLNSDIDKGGSLSLNRAALSVGVPLKLNDSLLLGTVGRYELDSYNFNNVHAPWEHINTLSLSSILQWRADDNWSYYGGGFVKMSAESGAALNKGTTGGGIAGFAYKFSDTLTLGAGLAVVGQLEDNVRALPIITAKWQFADYWRLDAGLTDVGTAGYGADVRWLYSKEWEFALGLQFHKSRFRIDGNSAQAVGNRIGNSQDGVGQESAGTLYLESLWHASPHVDLDGFVGVVGGGNLRVENSSGTEIGETDYKKAAIIGLKASLKF
jgi:hypothetical protein